MDPITTIKFWFTTKRVCAWCNPPHRLGGNPFAKRISHGICKAGKVKFLAGVKKSAAVLPIAGILLCAGRGLATPVQLAWNPSPSTNVDGYYIYAGTNSGEYFTRVYVPGRDRTNVVLNGVIPGVTNYFAATAVAGSLESPFSNEAKYVAPTNAPTPPIYLISAQESTNLTTWTTITNQSGSPIFFRLQIGQ